MSPGIQWALVIRTALGVAGTWVRAYVAWRTWREFR